MLRGFLAPNIPHSFHPKNFNPQSTPLTLCSLNEFISFKKMSCCLPCCERHIWIRNHNLTWRHSRSQSERAYSTHDTCDDDDIDENNTAQAQTSECVQKQHYHHHHHHRNLPTTLLAVTPPPQLVWIWRIPNCVIRNNKKLKTTQFAAKERKPMLGRQLMCVRLETS